MIFNCPVPVKRPVARGPSPGIDLIGPFGDQYEAAHCAQEHPPMGQYWIVRPLMRPEDYPGAGLEPADPPEEATPLLDGLDDAKETTDG